MSITAVIGLGQLGAAVARQLARLGADVIAIDSDMERVEDIKEDVGRAVCLDATDERALRAAGVGDANTVVLAMAEDQLEASALTTMVLRELGVGEIISRAGSEVQGKVLERLGVSQVVYPERQVGNQIARRILNPSVEELLPLTKVTSLGEVRIPKDLGGKTIGGVSVRREYGLNVVAVKRRSEVVSDDGAISETWSVDHNPGPDTELRSGDVLVVIGSDDAIRKFSEL